MSSVNTHDKNYNEVFGEGDLWSNLDSNFQLDACESRGFLPSAYSPSDYFDDRSSYSESEKSPGPIATEVWTGEGGYVYGGEMGEYSERSGESESSASFSRSRASPEKRSIFVHSCPSHFSDVNRARKSVFGSIFLRSTGRVIDESNLLKTITESSYSMLQSLLNSFERIISLVPPDSDKKQMMMAYKESIIRMLENTGLRRTLSDGSVHWDIYPVTQSYLFNLQVEDHIHQTRHLSKIEERIMSGIIQVSKMPYEWPTGSVWAGYWDGLGMSGVGTYLMPHGVTYCGKLKDGMFHDENAMLIYPNKFKAINCVYERGELVNCQFQFPDYLLHEKENWDYCQFPDRRFWSEVRRGFKPAKIAQKTENDPPRKIPPGCYDTSDGFFNPKTWALTSSTGEMLRVPVYEESMWIRKYCRKGFHEPTNFRPDLFENWYNYDTEFINEILRQHDNYRSRKISYDELQQFYANNDLLTPCAKYQKQKTASQIKLEEYMKTVPSPVRLGRRKVIKKYKGHVLSEVFAEKQSSVLFEKKMVNMEPSQKSLTTKKSKSFIKFQEETRLKSNMGVSSKYSKINFKRSNESLPQPGSTAGTESKLETASTTKSIPEKYLLPQPIQRPPFQERWRTRPTSAPKKICSKTDYDAINAPEPVDENEMKLLQKKRLQKFMKDIIMEAASKALYEERDRLRKRLFWATKVPTKKDVSTSRDDRKCMKVLEQLFESIPEKEEYADSDPSKTCNLTKLAEDKYNVLKYWGKRFFTLSFDE